MSNNDIAQALPYPAEWESDSRAEALRRSGARSATREALERP
jgi:hypothetical protein